MIAIALQQGKNQNSGVGTAFASCLLKAELFHSAMIREST